jgi:hypothetical protein
MASTKSAKGAVKSLPPPATTLDGGPATAYAAAASGLTATGPDVDVIGVRATFADDVESRPADDSAEAESDDEESGDGAGDERSEDVERTEDGGDASEADEESDDDDDEDEDEDPDEPDDVADAHDDGASPSVELDPVAFDIEMDEPEPWPAFTDDDIEPVDPGAYDEPVVFDGLA